MKSHWIAHQGRRIFYADYSNFGMNLDALQAELDAVAAALSQEPPGSVMVLNNMQDTGAPGVTTPRSRAVTRTNPYVRKRAVIGLEGVLRRGLLDILNVFTGRGVIHAFDDEKSALDWLVKE